MGVQIAEDGGLQSDAPKYSPYVKMTTRQVGNIIFNETRSLSGPDIDDARNAIAHVIRNGEAARGENRPITASSDVDNVPSGEENTYQASQNTASQAEASVVKGSIQPAAQLIST